MLDFDIFYKDRSSSGGRLDGIPSDMFESAVSAKLGVRFAFLANLVSFMSSVAENCGNFFRFLADLAYFHICVFFFASTVVAHVLLKPLLASWIWTVSSTYLAGRISACHTVIVPFH